MLMNSLNILEMLKKMRKTLFHEINNGHGFVHRTAENIHDHPS